MLLREASIIAIKRTSDVDELKINMDDFKKALKKVFPSVSKQDEMSYAKLQKSLKKARAHLENE